MNYKRKFKVHQITPCFSKVELEIISFIENKVNNLIIYERKRHYSQYYMNEEGKCILENRSGTLLISKFGFWKILQDEYDMEYTNIWKLIDSVFKLRLKLNIKY